MGKEMEGKRGAEKNIWYRRFQAGPEQKNGSKDRRYSDLHARQQTLAWLVGSTERMKATRNRARQGERRGTPASATQCLLASGRGSVSATGQHTRKSRCNGRPRLEIRRQSGVETFVGDVCGRATICLCRILFWTFLSSKMHVARIAPLSSSPKIKIGKGMLLA